MKIPQIPTETRMQRRFTGINTLLPSQDLQGGQVIVADNLFDVGGELLTRPGLQGTFTTKLGNPIYGPLAYVKTDQTTNILFGSGTNLYQVAKDGAVPATIGLPGSYALQNSCAGLVMIRSGLYAYLSDGTPACQLMRVQVNASNHATATTVAGQAAPTGQITPSLTNFVLDPADDATLWSSMPSPVWPNGVTVGNPETISAAGQIFAGGATGGGASSQPPPTGWKTGGDTQDFQAYGASVEIYLDAGVYAEYCTWEYPTPTYANAPIYNARVYVGSANGHSTDGGKFLLQCYAESAVIEGFNQASYADIHCTSHGTTSVIKSAGQPFAATGAGNGGGGDGNGDIGKVVTIWTSAGGIVPGNYTIIAVDGSNNATINGDLGATGTGILGTLGLDSGYGAGGGSVWGNKNLYELNPPSQVSGGFISSAPFAPGGSNTLETQVFSFSTLATNFSQAAFRIFGPASNAPVGVNTPSFKVVDVGLIAEASSTGNAIHVKAKDPVGQGAYALAGTYLKRDYTQATVNVSDLKIISDSAASSVVQSLGTYTFVTGDIGKVVNITAGVTFTPGAYTITAVAGGQATVTGDVGTALATNGTAAIFSVQDYSTSNILSSLYSAPETSGQVPLRFGFLAAGAGLCQIIGATNATPIAIQTATPHGYESGQPVTITSVGGNTSANGNWVLARVDSTHFTLNGSAGNSAYTSGGTANNVASAIRWSNPVSYSEDGTYFYVDISNIGAQSTAATLAMSQTEALYLQVLSDLPTTIDPKDLFTFGPLTVSGNLTLNALYGGFGGDYTWAYTEVNDNPTTLTDLQILTSGATSTLQSAAQYVFQQSDVGSNVIVSAGTGFTVGTYPVTIVSSAGVATVTGNVGTATSTGGTAQILNPLLVDVIESDPSPISAPPLQPNGYKNIATFSLPAPVNAATSHYFVYRYGGPFTDGVYRLVAKVSTNDTSTDVAIGTASNIGWSEATRTFTDNTPDASLLYVQTFMIYGRGSAPLGVSALCEWQNRIWAAYGSNLISSWLVTATGGSALYFNQITYPGSAYETIQGSGLVSVGGNDNDPIQQLVPMGPFMIIMKQRSLWIMVGTDGSNFTLSAATQRAGIGLAAPRAYVVMQGTLDSTTMYAGSNRVWLLGPDGVWEYDGGNYTKPVSTELERLLDPGLDRGSPISGTQYAEAAAIYHGRRIFFLMPTPPFSFIDLVIQGVNTQVSSMQRPFIPSDVGKTLTIGSGVTGFTAGTYTVASVSNGIATLNTGCGTVNAISGRGSITGDTQNQVAYVYDTRYQGWTRWLGMNMTGATGLTQSTDTDDLYFAGYDGQLYKLTGSGDKVHPTDSAVAVPFNLRTRGLGQENEDESYWRVKRMTRYLLDADANEVVSAVLMAGAEGSPTWSQVYTLAIGPNNLRQKTPNDIRGDVITLGISGSSVTQTTLTALGVEYALGRPRY